MKRVDTKKKGNDVKDMSCNRDADFRQKPKKKRVDVNHQWLYDAKWHFYKDGILMGVGCWFATFKMQTIRLLASSGIILEEDVGWHAKQGR